MPFANSIRRRPAPRFQTVQTFDEITTQRAAQAARRAAAAAPAAATTTGELTSWWRGGGHKRMYRIIDFKRDKRDIPAKVVDDRVRPEPLGAHRAADLRGRREALHPAAGRA